MFAWFVIDFLSMLILFNTFIDHRSLVAPMPFTDVALTAIQIEMFLHNKNILNAIVVNFVACCAIVIDVIIGRAIVIMVEVVARCAVTVDV
jgi:hypothetical protein